MEWININARSLDSAAYLGCDHTQRSTWLSLLRYCAGQENGGRIKAARDWPAALWLQLAGVDWDVVHNDTSLWKWAGNDLLVEFYSVQNERTVKKQRQAANRLNAKRRAERNAERIADCDTERHDDRQRKGNEKEGNEKEGKGKDNGAVAAAPSDTAVIEFGKSYPGDPANGVPPMHPQWVDRWLARLSARSGDWPRDWRRAMANAWRVDCKTDWLAGRKPGQTPKPMSRMDLKDQMTQLQEVIKKHPGNPDSTAHDPEHTTAEDRKDYRQLCAKLADVQRQIAMGQ